MPGQSPQKYPNQQRGHLYPIGPPGPMADLRGNEKSGIAGRKKARCTGNTWAAGLKKNQELIRR